MWRDKGRDCLSMAKDGGPEHILTSELIKAANTMTLAFWPSELGDDRLLLFKPPHPHPCRWYFGAGA